MSLKKHLSIPLLVLSLTTANARAQYNFVDLGTLGGNASGALGLNDAGQIVGWSTIAGCTTANGEPCRRAFLWENGSMTDLGMLAGDEESVARAINNSGVIAGTSESDVLFGFGTFHGTVWNAGTPSALPDLGNGQSFASDINENGQVVGYSTDPAFMRDRVVTWSSGAITNVGSTDWHSFNRGVGNNDFGLLVGYGWILLSPNDSILFDGTNWSDIGGAGQFQNSEAIDLNNAGIVVGKQAFPSGGWHPAIWLTPGGEATDLGLLNGHDLGELTSVNESGLAVGSTFTDSGTPDSHAIIWNGTQMIDLNTLMPGGFGPHLWDAMEINENGDIVGTALIGGEFHAYLLEYVPAGGSYCNSTTNSTGSPASMSTTGSDSIAANNFSLRAEPVPNNTFIFFYGPHQVHVPFGDGFRCVGGNPTRLGPAQFATGNVATRAIDLAGEGILPGSLNFQAWFRDPTGAGSGFNTSDGFEVIFTP
ncbi:MAG: putative HAF family extracellular repeat protein [Planctomycetota bacterium]|jgi:probable HAF family extracellular repeat protein